MTVKSKGIRLDIYVEDDNNTVFNLEMQTTTYKELPKRSRYYQGIIDLNMIEKGESYDILKESYVIFICTFDFFEKGRSVYEFENVCLEDSEIKLNDGTHKIFLNTKGDKSDINEELKSLLEYFDGSEPESELTRRIDRKVIAARKNERWRREYMSLQMEMNLKYREGLKDGMKAGEEKGQENTNKLIKILLKEKRYDDLEKSAQDIEYQNKLMKEYASADSLGGLETFKRNPVPVLYQSGYLTIKDYDRRFKTYILGFPNKEVEMGFMQFLLPNYTGMDNSDATFGIMSFVSDIESGNTDSFMKRLTTFFADTPYELARDLELHYQNVMFILFKLLGFYTQAEYHTSEGRIDMVVKTQDYIYVMEFKLDGTAEEAMQQIESKNYALPFECDGRKVVKIGVNFSYEKRNVEKWIVK